VGSSDGQRHGSNAAGDELAIRGVVFFDVLLDKGHAGT
jgi:hypothetical protein